MRLIDLSVRIAGVLLLLPGTLLAEYVCGPQWLEGLAAIDGSVYAATTWDPDGAGAQAPLLIVGGSFSMIGGVAANNIAAFDGMTWFPLGSGTNEIPWAFAVFEHDLIVGGRFTIADGVPVGHVARWDGTAFSPLGDGLNRFVNALAVYNGELYAGGVFSVEGTQSIARWNGSAWVSVGGGMSIWNCPVDWCGTAVHALLPYNGELVAGGYFTAAGGKTGQHIARWNGSTWRFPGYGVDNSVYALAEYNGRLIVGGFFRRAGIGGLVTVNHIAAQDGSNWSALGDGLDKLVSSLAVNNGHLYAGGVFQASGAVALSHIADWDGTGWSPLGTGVDSTVMGLTAYGGDLIAAGHFLTADGRPALHWARWRDAAPPRIITQPAGQSVMFGECAHWSVAATGIDPLHYQWRKSGAGLLEDDRVSGTTSTDLQICALKKADQGWYEVVVTDACHSTTSASAYLTVLCPGEIQSQPASQSVPVGGEARFSVVASGVGALRYQWRRFNVPLVDDERIKGAHSAELTISPVSMNKQKDSGSYSVLVTDDCGSMTSAAAVLTITCPAFVSGDLDRDCDVDQGDLTLFQSCAAGPSVPPQRCPRWPNNQNRAICDFDDDRDVDMDDFGFLQRCYSGADRPPDPACAN